LAAALAQVARDRHEITPAFQLLVYPMLDDRTSLRTDLITQGHYIWNQASNRFGWESYLGKPCGSAEVPRYAVPARREDLAGLPPAWIGVGTLDLFHDEDVAYARRLQDCGVVCELVVVPGAFHGFDMGPTKLQVVQDFRNSQVAALKRYLLLKS
jgi:acetyl esterase/lipase